MGHLPQSIVEMLKERKLATSEAHYFLQPLAPYDRTVDGVTVVMIVFHTGDVLFDSINRVLGDSQVKQFIIIDNGSTPDVEQKLRDLKDDYDHILLVQGHGNIGFGRAANLGAILATQPWLVFLNPDALLQPACIRNLVKAAQAQPNPCIVGARLLNPDLSEQRGARRGEVTPVTTLISLAHLHRWFPSLRKYEIHLEDEPLPDAPTSVPTISGACFLVSKHDFAMLRGFDPKFFLHVEDVDLCWRARRMGGTVLFHPHAEVVHEGHTSHVEPIFVEWKKGKGLAHYFKKRADTPWRKAYVSALIPVIIGVSLLRALLRKRPK